MGSAIYKGDNTSAFGNNFITIHVKNPLKIEVSKILFTVNCGIITREFTDESNFTTEDIELVVNFNSQETERLTTRNVGKVIVYDMENKQSTCEQYLVFSALNGVLCKCRK